MQMEINNKLHTIADIPFICSLNNLSYLALKV